MRDGRQLVPQLCMKRDRLDDLPPIVLPEGYSIRTSREGDARYWALIMGEAFGPEWTEEAFFSYMVDSPDYRPDRIFFVCDPAGAPCATGSAYRSQHWGEQTGYLHFVGTRPSYAGKRLGYAVSLAALHKFKEEGCVDAVLRTDDFRLAAIKTYLRLGFHPVILHENHPARWRRVLAALGEPHPPR